MKKLTKRPQMLLYAISGMGVNMLNLMMGSYICSALLVGGFGEKAIPYQTYTGHDLVIAGVWAVFVLVAKILDGIIDIPMASFTDRLKSRFGRRRPSLVIGLVPMIAAYLLFMLIPDKSGASLVNTIYYGVMLCIFYSFYTLTMVTYYATFTEIVDNVQDRTFISNVKSVCDIVYFILGYVAVRALLNGINIRPVALMVLPIVLTMLIPLFMIKEKSSLPEDIEKRRAAGEEEADSEEPLRTVGLVKSLIATFKNRAFIIWMFVYSLMTFGVQLFLGGINEYFSYVGMNMIFVMMSAFAPVPFTLLIYNRLMKKHGFGFSFRYTLLMFALGMLSMFGVSFLPQGTLKTVLSIVAGLLSSFAIGSLFAVAYSVPAELAAEEEKKTGISNSAMYFAVQGLFSGVAAGIGTGVVLTALKGKEGQNSGAIVYMTLISAIAMLVGFLLTYILPRSIVKMGKEKL
ncbi:MAG: MFS transporter [Lachnospiraceae bacterium]|nr:MFS transporter [Lachnospiraceae bacterium]